MQNKWSAIGKAYQDGVISLEKAVEMLGLADKPDEEVEKSEVLMT